MKYCKETSESQTSNTSSITIDYLSGSEKSSTACCGNAGAGVKCMKGKYTQQCNVNILNSYS